MRVTGQTTYSRAPREGESRGWSRRGDWYRDHSRYRKSDPLSRLPVLFPRNGFPINPRPGGAPASRSRRRARSVGCHPCRGGSSGGRFRWFRCAQPPATRLYASGIALARVLGWIGAQALAFPLRMRQSRAMPSVPRWLILTLRALDDIVAALSAAPAQFLGQDGEHKAGIEDQVAFPEPAWFLAQPEEPFETGPLHPAGRLFDPSAVKIEGCSHA